MIHFNFKMEIKIIYEDNLNSYNNARIFFKKGTINYFQSSFLNLFCWKNNEKVKLKVYMDIMKMETTECNEAPDRNSKLCH